MADVNYLALDSLRDPLEHIMLGYLDLDDACALGGASRRYLPQARQRRERLVEEALDEIQEWKDRIREGIVSTNSRTRAQARSAIRLINPELMRAVNSGRVRLDDTSEQGVARYVLANTPPSIILGNVMRTLSEVSSRVKNRGANSGYLRLIMALASTPLHVMTAAMNLLPCAVRDALWQYEVDLYESYVDAVVGDQDLPPIEKAFFTLLVIKDVADFTLPELEGGPEQYLREGAKDRYFNDQGRLNMRDYMLFEMNTFPSNASMREALRDEAEEVAENNAILPVSKLLHRQPPFMRGREYPRIDAV